MQSLITVQANRAGDTIPVSSMTIRNLDPAVKERLRIRAALHGHSMGAGARTIIISAVGAERPREVNLAEAIRQRFTPLGGADGDTPTWYLGAGDAHRLPEPWRPAPQILRRRKFKLQCHITVTSVLGRQAGHPTTGGMVMPGARQRKLIGSG
jgi:antitoxin FitA